MPLVSLRLINEGGLVIPAILPYAFPLALVPQASDIPHAPSAGNLIPTTLNLQTTSPPILCLDGSPG